MRDDADLPEPSGDDALEYRPRRGPTETPADAGVLGTKVFLASIGMLFAASLVGYVWTRLRANEWGAAYEATDIRQGLVVSTLIILGVSGALVVAERGIRQGRNDLLRKGMIVAAVLATLFLVSQGRTWWELIEFHGGARAADLSVICFYILTFVHAVHVVGGYVPLIWVVIRSYRGAYSAEYHYGVRSCALYWHFIDVVWLLMALALFIG